MYYRNPDADRYLYCQDDIVCTQNLKDYLDAQPMPDKGWWNLFTHNANAHRAIKAGTNGWFESNQRGLGALALMFDNRTMQSLVTSTALHTKALNLNNRARERSKVHMDMAISETLIEAGYTEYCHYPSLTQHTGRKSSHREKTWPRSAGR